MSHASEDNKLLIVLARRGGKLRELPHIHALQQSQALASKSRPMSARGHTKRSGLDLPPTKTLTPRTGTFTSRLRVARPTERSMRPQSALGQRDGFKRKDEAEDPLSLFKEKLNSVVSMDFSLDFCDRPYFRTALWEATWGNHEDIVRLLADHKASVSKADYQGRTPLHEAAYYGHARLVEFLLDQGHPIDCVDRFGQSPIFRAAEGGRDQVVESLAKRKARTDMLDAENVTVRHIAAFRGMPRMAEWLLYQGAYKNRFAIEERAAPPPSQPAKQGSRAEQPLEQDRSAGGEAEPTAR